MVNERLSPQIPHKKQQPHAMAMEIEDDTISDLLEAVKEETKQRESQPKRLKVEEKFEVESSTSRCGDLISTTWCRAEQKKFYVCSSFSTSFTISF